jgi:hypothetical protein
MRHDRKRNKWIGRMAVATIALLAVEGASAWLSHAHAANVTARSCDTMWSVSCNSSPSERRTVNDRLIAAVHDDTKPTWWSVQFANYDRKGDVSCVAGDLSPADDYELAKESGQNPNIIDNGDEVIVEQTWDDGKHSFGYYRNLAACKAKADSYNYDKHTAAAEETKMLEKYR